MNLFLDFGQKLSNEATEALKILLKFNYYSIICQYKSTILPHLKPNARLEILDCLSILTPFNFRILETYNSGNCIELRNLDFLSTSSPVVNKKPQKSKPNARNRISKPSEISPTLTDSEYYRACIQVLKANKKFSKRRDLLKDSIVVQRHYSGF